MTSSRIARSLALSAALLGSAFSPSIALACDGEAPAADTAQAPAGAQTVAYTVEGMSCSGCSGKVAAALKKLPGVYTVNVDLGKHIARIAFDPKKVTHDQIKAAISKADYTPSVVA